MELNKKNYIPNRDPLLLLTSYKQKNINTYQRIHDQRIHDQPFDQQLKVIFKGKRLLK
jgi:hypothetical protein